MRHVADQGQDTRVHAERGTATDDRDVHHGGGGHGGQHGADVQQQRRHVRSADRQLSGPVVAREPKCRPRRSRGHCQEQVVDFTAFFCHDGRGHGSYPLRYHHRPRGPYRDHHHGHHCACRQFASNCRSTAATTATTFHQTVSTTAVLITII